MAQQIAILLPGQGSQSVGHVNLKTQPSSEIVKQLLAKSVSGVRI